MSDKAALSEKCLYLNEVLLEEFNLLHGGPSSDGQNTPADSLPETYRHLHAMKHAALCLSGGGIRSASFGLGVLQGLAQHGLLEKFHYLSTVSGGGYIGSWFTTWIHRHKRGARGVIDHLQRLRRTHIDPEYEPIRRLRQYSQYLTPKWGLLSADTWTWVAIYLRNLLLNWLVMVPLFAAVLAIPRLWLEILRAVPGFNIKEFPVFPWILLVIGAGLAVWAIVYITRNLPVEEDERREEVNNLSLATAKVREGTDSSTQKSSKPAEKTAETKDERSFLLQCLLPLFGSAVCLTTFWIGIQKSGEMSNSRLQWFVVFGVALHLAGSGWYLVASHRPFTRKLKDIFSPAGLSSIFLIVFAGAIGGAFLWLAATSQLFDPRHLGYAASFGPPLLLALFILATAAYIGFASYKTSDAGREWWARSNGWMLVVAVSWSVLGWLVLFGPDAVTELRAGAKAAVASLGGVSAVLTLFFAPNPSTPANKTQGEKASWVDTIKSNAVSLAAPIFAAFIIIGIAFGTQWILKQVPLNETSPLLTVAAFIFLMATSGLAMGLFVNVNKFSLHGAYRDRLIRAYLGASNKQRKPNRFIGFDPKDNLPISELQKGQTGKFERPFHVINIALNLVGGKNLAWQQRKAESFTVTPLHAGSHRLGYRRAELYGGTKGPDGGDGMSLGTALTFSGAAASPNSGYHSSPLATFLMALFNVRLGGWLGNPGEHGDSTFRRRGPRFAVRPLLEETFGLTTDEKPYVFLSDGGHFENLGLYEMVLRRCRIIVVSDAGCDPKCELEDLGNAIRKIRIDLGVPIDFADRFDIHSRGTKRGKRWAIGTIRYSKVDGGTAQEQDGVLIYIKPAFYCDGKEPIDIFNYASASLTFPHETTADQWFSESQFESYRMLGHYTVEQVLKEIKETEWQKTEPLIDFLTDPQSSPLARSSETDGEEDVPSRGPTKDVHDILHAR